jgi:DNA repair protein RecO
VALTENHGQITALAKNAVQSRRFGGSLDLFVASNWDFTLKPGASLYHLSGAVVREPFDGIRKSFEKLTLASILSEIVIKASAQQGAEIQGGGDLFRLHSNALYFLNETPQADWEIPFLNAYMAKLLQWSGNQPRIQSCLQCSVLLDEIRPESRLKCILSSASWVCPECSSTTTRHIQNREDETLCQSMISVTARALGDFQMSFVTPIRQVVSRIQASKAEHQELFVFSEALFAYHIPGLDRKRLNGLRFLGL